MSPMRRPEPPSQALRPNEPTRLARVGSLQVPEHLLRAADHAGVGGGYGHIRGLGKATANAHSNQVRGSVNEVQSMDDRAFRDIVEQEIIEAAGAVSFDDIVALSDAKRLLNESVVLPFLIPEFFSGIRKPWKGVLLFGPPGTGKTMLAKAVCGMHGITFFSVSAATLNTKYWGESEKIARQLFTVARERAPAVIFFDEVDAIMGTRAREGATGGDESSRRLKTEILKQMDGVESSQSQASVLVIAASNCPWDLDEAFRRRLEKRIYVPLPDAESRLAMIAKNMSSVACQAELPLYEVAEATEGYSGADIRVLCREAAMMPVRRLLSARTPEEIQALEARKELQVPVVSAADFEGAVLGTRPSVSTSSIGRFEQWNAEFGSS